MGKTCVILVTGAGGKTGRTAVRALLAAGLPVRGLVRQTQQAAELRRWGAEAVVGDLYTTAVLRAALNHCHTLYHIPPNMFPHEVDLAHTLLKLAQNSSLRHIIYHSVLHPQTQEMPHHWAKCRVEELIFQAGLPYTILQPTAYMQNLLAYREPITANGRLILPYPPETQISLVDLQDVAAVVVRTCQDDSLRGGIYELVGTQPLSQTTVAAELAQVVGQEVTAVHQPLDRWEAQARQSPLSDYAVDALKKMFLYYTKYGLVGNSTVLRALLGREPISLSRFLEREWSRSE